MSSLFFYVNDEETSRRLWETLHEVKGLIYDDGDNQVTDITVTIYILPTTVEEVSEVSDDIK